MALFYTANGIAKDVELHIGNTKGAQEMKRIGTAVSSLQADGDELDAIREQFTGIRMHEGRVVEWFGDDAAFIAMHFNAVG
jgi:hypothetical protein